MILTLDTLEMPPTRVDTPTKTNDDIRYTNVHADKIHYDHLKSLGSQDPYLYADLVHMMALLSSSRVTVVNSDMVCPVGAGMVSVTVKRSVVGYLTNCGDKFTQFQH